MLSAWVNDLVLLLSGALLGASIVIVNAIAPQSYQRALDRKPGEGFLEGVDRGTREQNEIMARTPRLRLALLAFLGVIAGTFAVIVFSPVELSWWPLLGGLAVGAAGAQALLSLARAGKLTSEGPTAARRSKTTIE